MRWVPHKKSNFNVCQRRRQGRQRRRSLSAEAYFPAGAVSASVERASIENLRRRKNEKEKQTFDSGSSGNGAMLSARDDDKRRKRQRYMRS